MTVRGPAAACRNGSNMATIDLKPRRAAEDPFVMLAETPLFRNEVR